LKLALRLGSERVESASPSMKIDGPIEAGSPSDRWFRSSRISPSMKIDGPIEADE